MNPAGTTRIVKYSPRVVSKHNRTPKKVRVKKSCEPMLVRKCKSVRRKSRKPVRRRSKSVRRRSKSRKSRKPIRRRLKSVRRGSKSVRKRSKIPQKPTSANDKRYHHKPLVQKKKIPKIIDFEAVCRGLECYTGINQISFDVIRDYNTEKTNIINQEANIKQIFDPDKRIDFIVEKSREYMFDDLFTFMWGKIMSDPIFKLKIGINLNLLIIVFPDMVLDLEYGKKLVPQIEQFIKTIKKMDTKSGSDYITPFQLGTPNHIIPGIIRWREKTIEVYDMNEVVSETVMQDAFRNQMDLENLKDEKNQWTWTWNFSCAPFHSQILKQIRNCSKEYKLNFPNGLCASISIFMVIKNLQAPTKSLSEIYREVSGRLVTPGGIQGVLNEMLKYFKLLDEWYKKFYEYFQDDDLRNICKHKYNITKRDQLEIATLAEFGL